MPIWCTGFGFIFRNSHLWTSKGQCCCHRYRLSFIVTSPNWSIIRNCVLTLRNMMDSHGQQDLQTRPDLMRLPLSLEFGLVRVGQSSLYVVIWGYVYLLCLFRHLVALCSSSHAIACYRMLSHPIFHLVA